MSDDGRAGFVAVVALAPSAAFGLGLANAYLVLAGIVMGLAFVLWLKPWAQFPDDVPALKALRSAVQFGASVGAASAGAGFGAEPDFPIWLAMAIVAAATGANLWAAGLLKRVFTRPVQEVLQ